MEENVNVTLEMFCVPFAKLKKGKVQDRNVLVCYYDAHIGLLRALGRIFHYEVFMRHKV